MFVALLDLHTQPNPAQGSILAVLRALARTRPFVPLLICRAHSLLADSAAAEGLPVLSLRSDWPAHPLSRLRIWWRLRKHRRVMLHSFGGQAAALARLLALRRRPGQAIVTHTHFFTPDMPRRLPRESYAAADCVVCGSSALARLVQEASGLQPDRLRIIPPGSAHVVYPARVRQRDGRVAICMPGALAEGYGQEVLIHTMAALWQVEDLPPWEVRLVGSGPMFQHLLGEAQKLGVLDRLAILGEQDVREVLPHCTVLVLPAGELVYAPGLAQGWGAGLPVICPAVPAARELARDRENALFVAPDNPQALAAALLRVIRDPGLAETLVRGGTAALASVSEEGMIAGCFALYHELMDRHGWVAQPYAREDETGVSQLP